MMMHTMKFLRKPLEVEAVQVTAENLYEVAKWCDGEVHTRQSNSLPFKYIKVNVLNPNAARQEEANVGSWVLKSDRGFKIYTSKALELQFDPV